MKRALSLLRRHLLSGSAAARVVAWACYLESLVIVRMAVQGLRKFPGTRADFLLGLGLACVVALFVAMLGTMIPTAARLHGKVATRSRWAEFAGYVGCLSVMIAGTRSLPALDLAPAQFIPAVLLVCAMSLGVLVLGMLTTLVRALMA
jgi:hypothetical protein